MTSENSRYAVDSWSRFVSYCSLVVAVGALAWVLFGFGTLPNWGESSTGKSPESASINMRLDKEVENRKQQDEEIRSQSNLQQAELTTVTEAFDELLREHQQLVYEARAGGVEAASHTASTAETTASSTDGDDDADGEDDTDGEDANTNLASGEVQRIPITPAEGFTDDNSEEKSVEEGSLEPLLAHVHENLKPGADADVAILTIRNRGGSQAVLTRVEFTPSFADDSIFEVDSFASTLAVGDDKDVLSIVFSEKDNLAATEGKHGVYARELSDVHVIPAASDLRIRLAIANSKHVGWGFHGTFRLEYNGLEPLTIEDAQLVFVGADDAVRRQ